MARIRTDAAPPARAITPSRGTTSRSSPRIGCAPPAPCSSWRVTSPSRRCTRSSSMSSPGGAAVPRPRARCRRPLRRRPRTSCWCIGPALLRRTSCSATRRSCRWIPSITPGASRPRCSAAAPTRGCSSFCANRRAGRTARTPPCSATAGSGTGRRLPRYAPRSPTARSASCCARSSGSGPRRSRTPSWPRRRDSWSARSRSRLRRRARSPLTWPTPSCWAWAGTTCDCTGSGWRPSPPQPRARRRPGCTGPGR